MDNLDKLGERLRELRESCGLSQEAVAGQIGVSPQAVSKWENGKAIPELGSIVPLANLFHVSTDQLLKNEGRRDEWEEKWQKAEFSADKYASLRVIEEALAEFPRDRVFRYRRGCREYILAAEEKDEGKRRRLLRKAEEHLAALYEDCPDYTVAGDMLFDVLLLAGKREEARRSAEASPNRERLLLRLLEGEELREQKRKVLQHDVMTLLGDLMGGDTPEAWDAAEGIILRGMKNDDGALTAWLLSIESLRADDCLRRGDSEGAIAALTRWVGYIRDYEEKEAAGFPAGLLPPNPQGRAKDFWQNLFDSLRRPIWNPLRGREDFLAQVTIAGERMEALVGPRPAPPVPVEEVTPPPESLRDSLGQERALVNPRRLKYTEIDGFGYHPAVELFFDTEHRVRGFDCPEDIYAKGGDDYCIYWKLKPEDWARGPFLALLKFREEGEPEGFRHVLDGKYDRVLELPAPEGMLFFDRPLSDAIMEEKSVAERIMAEGLFAVRHYIPTRMEGMEKE